MKVTCPNCKTVYNLPDAKVRSGVKLRCTVCQQVFALPKAEPEIPYTDNGQISISIGKPDKPKKKRKAPLLFFFLLLLLLSAGGVWQFTTLLDPVKTMIGFGSAQEAPTETEEEKAGRIAEMVKDLQIQNIRQFTVKNEKIGNIVVIEGKVFNGFDEPRELIRVEAALQDEAGSTLISKSQLAGPTISLFQLQVLSEAELEQGLSNKLDILTNNTNIPPGGSVPFMVVFYEVPEQAKRFNVTVVEASRP